MARKAVLLAVLVLLVGLGWWVLGSRGPQTRAPEGPPASRDESASAPAPLLRGTGEATPEAPPQEPVQEPAGRAPPPAPAPAPARPGSGAKPWRIAGPSREAGTGDVRVHVLGLERAALQDVRVFVRPAASRAGEPLGGSAPDADGVVLVSAVPPGEARVETRIGTWRRGVSVDVVAGRTTELEMALPRVAPVSGRVLTAEEAPLAGVTLRFDRVDATVGSASEYFLDDMTTVTDENGAYRLEQAPAGRWMVALHGGVLGAVERRLASIATNGSDPLVRDFVVGRTALRGVVRDEATGAPIPNAHVRLQETGEVRVTAGDGSFAFVEAPVGALRLTLSVTADGYAHRLVETPAEGSDDGSFEVLLSAGATLRVTLRDAEGRPVPGKFWLWFGPASDPDHSVGHELVADEAGVCTYPSAGTGAYRVGVLKDGYTCAPLETELRAGENALSFVLVAKAPAPGGATEGRASLHGVVRDASSLEAVGGVRLGLRSGKEAWSRADGTYAFPDLAAGTYVLQVSKDGYGIRFVSGLVLAAGEDRTCDVLLEPAATVALDLVGKDGKPVVGMVVLAFAPLEGEEGTRVGTGVLADANGHVVFRQVVPGRYRIRIRHDTGGKAELETVIAEGENHLSVRLE